MFGAKRKPPPSQREVACCIAIRPSWWSCCGVGSLPAQTTEMCAACCALERPLRVTKHVLFCVGERSGRVASFSLSLSFGAVCTAKRACLLPCHTRQVEQSMLLSCLCTARARLLRLLAIIPWLSNIFISETERMNQSCRFSGCYSPARMYERDEALTLTAVRASRCSPTSRR